MASSEATAKSGVPKKTILNSWKDFMQETKIAEML